MVGVLLVILILLMSATKHFMLLVNSSGVLYFHRGDGNAAAATNADFAGCGYMLLNANYITDA